MSRGGGGCERGTSGGVKLRGRGGGSLSARGSRDDGIGEIAGGGTDLALGVRACFFGHGLLILRDDLSLALAACERARELPLDVVARVGMVQAHPVAGLEPCLGGARLEAGSGEATLSAGEVGHWLSET